MRVISSTAVILLLTVLVVSAQEMKIPEKCVAAEGATASYEGYASRVIHQKTGIELVLVPAGSFTMGQGGWWGKREGTFVRPFYIGKTEVTNAQYKKFMEQTGYDGRQDIDPVYDMYLLHLRGKSIMPTGDNFPVIYVGWHNVKAFCEWAGGLDLPTEAEWEYCCRAGTTTAYSFGDDEDAFGQYGWATTTTNGEDYPHEVAQLQPNPWGLYDMHGNVWEWCLDDYIQQYEGAPADGSARYDNRITKVLRGGAWSTSTRDWVAGCMARFNNAPTNAFNDAGFRVVCRLP